jgi:hypothetical protein
MAKMRKALAGMVGVGVLLLAPVRDLRAQVTLGYTDIGGVIGLGNIGDASIAFGGRFEKVFKKLPDLGDGLLGIGVSADVYSYNFGSAGSVRYIPFGATANYHFKLDPKNKFDAFLGAGLGFQTVSCSGFGSIGCGFSSGLYFIGRAGGRYFMKPNLALYADAGAGAASVNIGVTVKLK